MEKKCLIIGKGPSMNLVKDIEFDGTIISCHQPLHKKTNFVCSSDANKFKDAEIQAILNNIQLVIGIHFAHKKNKIPKEYHSKVIFHKCKHLLTSGIFAMEWAISQGYTILYTAGIDFYTDDDGIMYPKRHTDPIQLHHRIKEVITDWVKQGIKIYKVEKKSILPIEVKFPN